MATIKVRRDTSSDWASADPVLAQGEPGYELNKYKLKIGDGSTAWSVLNYFGEDPLTFNPTQARQYTGATAGGRQGYRPLISGTRNIIDNGGDHTLKIYTASTGVIERTITSPNAGDGNYYGFAEKGAVAADDTFVVTSENYQTPATNSRLRIYKVSDGTMVGTLLRATVANDSSDNTVDGMTFGRVMSIKDSYLLVSNTEYSASASGAGVVHVYKTANGTWSDIALEGSIAPAGPVVDGNYGCSLDMHGDFGVIGHRGNSSGTVDIVNVSTRALVATIAHPAGGSSNELFGNTVKFIGRDGQYIAVGAPGQSASAGSVYIFKTTDGTWTDGSLVSTINNPNAYNDSAGDQFGLDLSGTSKYLTIAASHEDNQTEGGGGPIDWSDVSVASTTVSDDDEPGSKGVSISSDGNYASFGSATPSYNGTGYSGKVWILNGNTGSVLHSFQNPTTSAAAGSYFGTSVATNNTYTAVGTEETVSGNNKQGRVYVFNNSTGSLVYTIDNPSPGANKYFGSKLAIDETHLVISEWSQGNSDSDRKVHLYDLSNGNRVWTANKPSNIEHFGSSVSISDSYVGVGAWMNYSGHALVLNKSNGSVLRTITSPYTSEANKFGEIVSITDDYFAVNARGNNTILVYNPANGNLIRTISQVAQALSIYENVLAVGNRGYQGTYSNQGAVYIYDMTNGSIIETINTPNPIDTGFFGINVSLSSNGRLATAGSLEERIGWGSGQTFGNMYILQAAQESLGTEAGVNYIYSTTTGDWTDTALATTLKNPDLTNGGGDGLTAVDMYADRMLAGYTLAEDGSTTNVGRVYEYSLYD